jgi:hypothetical protein
MPRQRSHEAELRELRGLLNAIAEVLEDLCLADAEKVDAIAALVMPELFEHDQAGELSETP